MQPLNGFRDFFPDDCAVRNGIFRQWREVARRYGFREYDGPPLEPLELFTQKSGEEIVGQLYHFTDKGDREVALRPEMTPTLARMVAARHRSFKKPVKWFSIPQVFRYERPQKGRLREHYQLNCDLIGEASLEAEVELIAFAIDVLREFGLTEQDFVVRLSDRQFWTDYLRQHQVPEEAWYAFFQAIDKSERESEEKTREKLGIHADAVGDYLEKGGTSERLETVVQGLIRRGLGDYVKIDLRVTRGLAYYTGIVFELFDRQGEFRAIAGGGRYDHLLKNVGGVDLPALGFGMGDVVLGELLKARGKSAAIPFGLDAFILIPDETYRATASLLLQQLRSQGLAVDYPLIPAKLGKQFELAEDRAARFGIIVDAKSAENQVEVKNLKTRDQSTVALGGLVDFLKMYNR